ncbi:MAG: hypothetical protein IBJ09_11120 [Bacteroidia bacterium]|nr:hypothetical protein [Bacteroidia bacterium]
MKARMILGVMATVAVFTACKKENSNPSPADTFDTVSKGEWQVQYFFDDNDETYKFEGYVLTFNSNGTVTAVKGTDVVNGTWNTGIDDSQTKLDLNFNNSNLFDELNDDWHVQELSATKIVTEDVSGGNGETDYLTLQKI